MHQCQLIPRSSQSTWFGCATKNNRVQQFLLHLVCYIGTGYAYADNSKFYEWQPALDVLVQKHSDKILVFSFPLCVMLSKEPCILYKAHKIM